MGRPTYPSDKRRWFRLASDVGDATASLTDAEFRAFILVLAEANEQKAQQSNDSIIVGRYRITSVAPNRRGSNATATRVLRELCAKQTWAMQEDDASVTISVRNWSEFQGFTPTKLPQDSDETPSTTPTPTPTNSTAPSGAEAREPPKLEGFVRMLKGEIPTGLDGQTWPTPEAWFDHHREILVGEAQKQTGEESGTKFNGAFRSTLMRYWNSKKPKGRATNGGTHGPKPGTLDAALKDQLDRIDREERENAARDEATSQLSLSSGSES